MENDQTMYKNRTLERTKCAPLKFLYLNLNPKRSDNRRRSILEVIRSGGWNPYKWDCMHAKSLQLYLTLCDPMSCSLQAPLSMGVSRQEYWSGLPCPPWGDLPQPGVEPMSLVPTSLVSGLFTTSATWEAHKRDCVCVQSCFSHVRSVQPYGPWGSSLVKRELSLPLLPCEDTGRWLPVERWARNRHEVVSFLILSFSASKSVKEMFV